MLKIIYAFFVALLLSIPAWAEETAPVQWQVLQTSQAHDALEDVHGLPASDWVSAQYEIISKGYSSGSLWLKTDFQANRAGTYVLELANPFLDHVSVALVRKNNEVEIQTGGLLKPYQGTWAQRYHNEIFEFELNAGEQVQLYIQGESARALIVWPRLTTKGRFFEQGLTERIWLGLFAGLFVALTVYFFLLWRAVRDRGYLEYMSFLALNGVLQMHVLGVLREHFLYPYPQVSALFNVLLPIFVFVAFLRFTHYFLELDTYSPHYKRIIRYVMWVIWSMLPLYFLVSHRLVSTMVYVLGPFVVWLGLAVGYVVLRRGYRPARFYMLAQVALGVGGLLYSMLRFNVIPAHPWILYSFQTSSVLQVLIIALALSDKINILQTDRVKAQNERWATERRMVEVLRESEALLEQRVAERTVQLEEALQQQCRQGEVLVQANQQLISLNEERTAFLGIAAHDLKNPTAAIMSYVDLIIERWNVWDDANKHKRLVSIRDLAQLIHAIIRNLLDVNAIEHGRYQLVPEVLDVGTACKELVDEYHDRVEAKNIHLYLRCEQPLKVFFDPAALHQVLDNLISNAVKYSPHGCKVELSVVLSAPRAVQIRVRDEGPGISSEDQAKLYRKFTRLSARPTGGEHSTGLGLSIVKRIVEASGGQVFCESRLGEGATFIVQLELAE